LIVTYLNTKEIINDTPPDTQATYIKCDQCEFTATDVKIFVKHILVNHNQSVINCETCGFETNKDTMTTHVMEVHGNLDLLNTLSCQITNGFGNFELFKDELKDILKKLIGGHNSLVGGHNAIMQELTVIKTNGLTRNEVDKRQTTLEIFCCELCDFTSNQRSTLMNHKKEEHNKETPSYAKVASGNTKTSLKEPMKAPTPQSKKRVLWVGDSHSKNP
jgi:hypothetical protein